MDRNSHEAKKINFKNWTIRNGSTRYAKKFIRHIKERIELFLENPETPSYQYIRKQENLLSEISVFTIKY